jgi:FtsP/CotA-like multicopper oxidase with cupredoxin domain
VRRRFAPAALVGALALMAGFALASCGSDDEAGETTATTTETTTMQTTTEPPPGPTEVRIRVVNGGPAGGTIVRETVDKGDRVVVIVTSDVSDHVHVHGYDVVRDVTPGKRARIAFRARLPGRFVIELEDRHAQIAELTVNP